jgi:LDH2 family malate/lactate/ureidoglycolate dehydrogenase
VSRSGQVNYTEAEEILQSQPVMTGMFTIDSHLAFVLFNSGASHSFISMRFAERHNISIMAIPKAYRISTLGAQIFINTQTDTVSLVLATHTYRLRFMVLPGHGIDAILGMKWGRFMG